MMIYADSFDVSYLIADGLESDLALEGVRLALSSEPGYMIRYPWEADHLCCWVRPLDEPRPTPEVVV